MESEKMSLHHAPPCGPYLDGQFGVMIVEDDTDFSDALSMLLKDDGFSVVHCRGAEAALRCFRQGALPDLIVLDLHMPEMNGWQFRVAQRAEPKWASIPVVAISGDLSEQARAIDAAAYIGKPFDPDRFLDVVKRVARDLDRRRERARAAEMARLISLGSLVGGIAHEINNPLTFVRGSHELLQRQILHLANPSSGSEPFSAASALRALERAQVGIERIASVVQSVSIFASGDQLTVEPLDVHQVLESSLHVASNEIRHCAAIERSYSDVPRVRGNAAKLGQVFLNLLLNAVSAIRQSSQHDHVIRLVTSVEAQHAVVLVSDTASVLSPDVATQLFDPLTASTSGKMDLRFGLAISREVIESMEGTIDVESTGSRGVTYRLRLPSCTRDSYPAPAPIRAVAAVSARPSVLVVDDEPLVCELLSATLSDDYAVVTFCSPRAALAALLDGNFDVIVCDVMMPDLDGIALYECVARTRPELCGRFVFVTGGAFTERARQFLTGTSRPTLRKPWDQQELLQTVKAVLKSEASSVSCI